MKVISWDQFKSWCIANCKYKAVCKKDVCPRWAMLVGKDSTLNATQKEAQDA